MTDEELAAERHDEWWGEAPASDEASIRILPELVQGSEEWHDQRRGMVTASVVGQLISISAPDALTVECPNCQAAADSPCISLARKTPTPLKTFHSERSVKASSLPPVYGVADNDTSRGLTAILAAERITGNTDPTYINSDMWRGIEDEPRARDKYAEHFKVPVAEVGFMVRDDWGFEIGYSPDGLVGDDGLIEVKSRRQKKHLLTVISDDVPAENMAQIQCGLLVSGRSWCDYISYSGGMHLWVKRVEPDERWFTAILEAVAAFEKTAERMASDYLGAVVGMPLTERVTEMEMTL